MDRFRVIHVQNTTNSIQTKNKQTRMNWTNGAALKRDFIIIFFLFFISFNIQCFIYERHPKDYKSQANSQSQANQTNHRTTSINSYITKNRCWCNSSVNSVVLLHLFVFFFKKKKKKKLHSSDCWLVSVYFCSKLLSEIDWSV